MAKVKIFTQEKLYTEYKNYIPLTLHNATEYSPSYYSYKDEDGNNVAFDSSHTIYTDTDGKYFGIHTGWGSYTSENITNTGHYYGIAYCTSEFDVQYHPEQKYEGPHYYLINPIDKSETELTDISEEEGVTTDMAINPVTGKVYHFSSLSTEVKMPGTRFDVEVDLPQVYDVTYVAAKPGTPESYVYVNYDGDIINLNKSWVNVNPTTYAFTYTSTEITEYSCELITSNNEFDSSNESSNNSSADSSDESSNNSSADSSDENSDLNGKIYYKYTSKDGKVKRVAKEYIRYEYHTTKDVEYPVTYTEGTDDVSTTDVINDLSRFIGALYRKAKIENVIYNKTTYTWNSSLNKVGSNYANGSTTLMSDLMKTLVSAIQIKNEFSFVLTVNNVDIHFNISTNAHEENTDNTDNDVLFILNNGFDYKYSNWTYKGKMVIDNNTLYYQITDETPDTYTYTKNDETIELEDTDVRSRILADDTIYYYTVINENVKYILSQSLNGILPTYTYTDNGETHEVALKDVLYIYEATEHFTYPVKYTPYTQESYDVYNANIGGIMVEVSGGLNNKKLISVDDTYVFVTTEYGSYPTEVKYVDPIEAHAPYYTFSCPWEIECIRGDYDESKKMYKYTHITKQCDIPLIVDGDNLIEQIDATNANITKCKITVLKPYKLIYHSAVLASAPYWTFVDENGIDVLYSGEHDMNMDEIISAAIYENKYSKVDSLTAADEVPSVYYRIRKYPITAKTESEYTGYLKEEVSSDYNSNVLAAKWLAKDSEMTSDVKISEETVTYKYDKDGTTIYVTADEVKEGFKFSLPDLQETTRAWQVVDYDTNKISYYYKEGDEQITIPSTFNYRISSTVWIGNTEIEAEKCEEFQRYYYMSNNEKIYVDNSKVVEGYYHASLGRLYKVDTYAGIDIYKNQLTINNIAYTKVHSKDYYTDRNIHIIKSKGNIVKIYVFDDENSYAEWKLEGSNIESDLIKNIVDYGEDSGIINSNVVITYNNWILSDNTLKADNIAIINDDNTIILYNKISRSLKEVSEGKIIANGDGTYSGINPYA